MSRILDAPLTLRHVLVLAVVGLTLVVGGSALATQPNVFGSGTIRLTSAASTTPIDIGSGDPATKVLFVPFTVPAGHQADVQATFSATLIHLVTPGGDFAYCFGKFTLDNKTSDATFHPGAAGYQLIGGSQSHEPDAVSVGMTGWRAGVAAGRHFVNVYVAPEFDGCELQERALNVVINLR